MQVLINSFSPTAEGKTDHFQTLTNYNLNQVGGHSWSITLRSNDCNEGETLNGRILETLKEISSLSDNWDEEGSLAPTQNVVQIVSGLIYSMNAIGQEIYNIAPGPNREIMLDLRNGTRSLEVLIYPSKMRFVKFSASEVPIQGEFSPNLYFTELIAWLNSNEQ
ncbi:MAG: hypothetical protein ACO1NW_14230 [Chitinophagaceae bacterium]